MQDRRHCIGHGMLHGKECFAFPEAQRPSSRCGISQAQGSNRLPLILIPPSGFEFRGLLGGMQGVYVPGSLDAALCGS